MYFFRHFLGPDWPSQRWCSSCSTSSLHLDRWLKKTLFLFVFQISFSLYGMLESILFSLGGHLSQLSAKQAWTNVPREKGNKKTTFWSRLFSPRANYVFLGWAHYSLNCCSFQFINSCHMARNEMLPSMFISVMKILDFFLLHIISFQWQ